jgi:hypothetical protein
MASVRRRVLADGTERFDVNYHHDGRPSSLTFDNQDDADRFAHIYNLRRRRWPLAPLTDLTGLTPSQFAARHNLARGTLQRAEHDGLTDIQADHWATAAGYHPLNVWGWAWVTAAQPSASAEAVA